MQTDFSRREFLTTAGLGAAGITALAQARPEGSETASGGRAKRVELAIATICTDGFGNHHHEPAFRVIPALGFRNVEFNLWYPDTITPAYIRTIRERCERTGLRAISLQGTGFGGEGRDAITKDISHKLVLMQGCKELGCRIVKCTGSRRGTNGGLKAVIEVCQELAPAAEEMGMLVTLENHANNVLETVADYEEVFAAVQSKHVGMCLDTGHFEGVGIDLIEVIDRFHERILHVDLKDCKERGKGHNTVPFGEGVTDFDAFLRHLFSKGYSGYLVVEQAWPEPKGPWAENLRKACQRFKEFERD